MPCNVRKPNQAVTATCPLRASRFLTTTEKRIVLRVQQDASPGGRPGGVMLTLQFQPVGGTESYRYFDLDEGIEVPQTFERAGSFGSATVVAFGVHSADGQ